MKFILINTLLSGVDRICLTSPNEKGLKSSFDKFSSSFLVWILASANLSLLAEVLWISSYTGFLASTTCSILATVS